jgi:Domain of unknown function (DUF4160)
MPEIARFGGFKLLMFLSGREPSDFAAKMRISNGDLLAGDAPNKVLRQARRWVEEHRAELLAMWDEFQR